MVLYGFIVTIIITDYIIHFIQFLNYATSNISQGL